MDELQRQAEIDKLRARLKLEQSRLTKDKRAATNKRKYLLGSLVLDALDDSQQMREWVLKAVGEKPPLDNANQKAIMPLLMELAKKENCNVPELPEPPVRERKKKDEEEENKTAESSRATESTGDSETSTTVDSGYSGQYART